MSGIRQKLGITAVLMVILGFGMMHSARGISEIISLLLIGAGCAILFYLIVWPKKN